MIITQSLCICADLFKELLIAEPRGRSVDECMRVVILNMIRERQPLKHWAAFTIVGSPALRLFKPDNSAWGVSGLDKHSFHAFQGNNNCPYSCRVCGKGEEDSSSEYSASIRDVSDRIEVEIIRTLGLEELEERLHNGARLVKLGIKNLYKLVGRDGSFEFLSFNS